MYTVDLYLRVRLACHVDGLSQREAASRFGIARETVRKMLRHSEPPGYRRRQPPKRPKLAPFTDIIDRILEEDRTVHRKQHHTAKRIFERLRDEHGFTGKETIVKDYVRERRLRRREMFVPLSHPPGHAQADFGEADAVIAGVKYRAHFFVMTLPHSDACFVAAYPAATTEAWLDGHNRAFVFFGGVPQSILYDNDKCLVSRILSDGTRQSTVRRKRQERCVWMARKMTEWPSKRGPITKIMPSDGCIGDTVPLAVGKWYDFREFGWYMGNVGSKNGSNNTARDDVAAALTLAAGAFVRAAATARQRWRYVGMAE